MWLLQNKYLKFAPFALLFVVFILGSLMDVMDVDAAQYAAISQEMAENGSFLQVLLRGGDYLDKPPLLFWISTIAFKIFGVNNFAFRFFPILISFLGFYATYRLSRLYYNEVISYLAALLIASSQAYMLMNHDLRTDNMLTSLVVIAIWQIADYNLNKRWLSLFLGFGTVGLAMLAKGPIGIMAPAFAFSIDFAMKKQWSNFLKWEWLVGLVVVGVILLPMSIGLYQQFDAQPEKGTSGLRFFYWTQSFGRITGESTWNNNPDPLFQVHSFLWGFLPWSLLTFTGYIRESVRIWKSKFKMPNNEEALIWGGVTMVFLAMSLSKFQLPHYTYPAFPLIAIIGAKFIYYLAYHPKIQKGFKWAMGTQIFTIVLLWILAFVLISWVFPSTHILLWAVSILFCIGSLISIFKAPQKLDKIILPSFLSIVGINVILNTHFYPSLIKYQSETQAAKYIAQQKDIPKNRVYRSCEENWYSFDFYLGGSVPILSNPHIIKTKGAGDFWIYTDQANLLAFKTIYPNLSIIQTFDDFAVTGLTPEFLNPNTRSQALKKNYLIRISQ